MRVDVGVVCVQLGTLQQRRGATRSLAQELVQWADQLMYRAKKAGSTSVDMALAHVDAGRLVAMGREDAAIRSGPAMPAKERVVQD